jgi:toxin ParE1/3/4
MRRVSWSSEALDELEAIVAYIAADNPNAAGRYRDRLLKATFDLAEFPERGRLVLPWVRELTLIRPYIIQYAVVGDEVRILQVRHSARRPER